MARMFRLSMDARELAEFRIPLAVWLNNRMQRGGYFYSTQANLWAAGALSATSKQAGRRRSRYAHHLQR